MKNDMRHGAQSFLAPSERQKKKTPWELSTSATGVFLGVGVVWVFYIIIKSFM